MFPSKINGMVARSWKSLPVLLLFHLSMLYSACMQHSPAPCSTCSRRSVCIIPLQHPLTCLPGTHSSSHLITCTDLGNNRNWQCSIAVTKWCSHVMSHFNTTSFSKGNFNPCWHQIPRITCINKRNFLILFAANIFFKVIKVNHMIIFKYYKQKSCTNYGFMPNEYQLLKILISDHNSTILKYSFVNE